MIARREPVLKTVTWKAVQGASVKRGMVILLLLLVCLYAGYTAGYKGYANAWYYQAEFAINAWAKQGKVSSRSEYDSALTAITKAHDMDPSYPHYAHINGRILHWGIISGFEDESQYTTVRSLYLAAVARRPMWPDVWMDLATINNYLDGYDSDTQQYLAEAMATGPYINAVIAGSVRILLSNWSALSGQDKQLVFTQFGKSIKQPRLRNEILTYATSIDKQKLLCVQLKFNPEYHAVKSTSSYHKYCQ